MQRRSRTASSAKVRRNKSRSEPRRSASSGEVFASNLRRIRRAQKLDVAALAKRIGRTQEMVERMLAGRSNPGLAVIDDIARRLDVPVAELVRGL